MCTFVLPLSYVFDSINSAASSEQRTVVGTEVEAGCVCGVLGGIGSRALM